MVCDLVLVASVIDGHGSQGTSSPAQGLEWLDPQAQGVGKGTSLILFQESLPRRQGWGEGARAER